MKFFKSIPNESDKSGASVCQLINGTMDGANSNGIDGIFDIWDGFKGRAQS